MTPKRTILSNGMRVIYVPHRDTAAATAYVMFEVGSRYEAPKLNGAAHFIEHMMFKGTERRPTTLAISRDLDSVGAEYNAFTGKDYTGYYIKLPAEKLPLAVDMLEDMLFHSVYRQKDFDAERQVIHEEIRMYEDNPLMFVEEIMEEEIYRGSTLGWRISGTVATMNGIGLEAMKAFRDKYYVPSRTVIAIAGKFDEEETQAMLEEKFGRHKSKARPKEFAKFEIAKAEYRGARIRIAEKETEQVQACIAFPCVGYHDPKTLAALQLLSDVLGGTMSSRLFVSVREKAGLAYSVRSSLNTYQDVGNFAIQAGLAKAKLEKALAIIMKEVRKVAEHGVTTKELAWAKDHVRGRTVLALEDSSRLADWFARQELLTRRVETPEEKLARLVAVTEDDVRRVAKEVFRPSRMTVAVIGPIKDDTKIRKSLKLA